MQDSIRLGGTPYPVLSGEKPSYCHLRTSHKPVHPYGQPEPLDLQTDDILPFRTNLLGEYAMLLAPAPCGLGLSEDEVERVAAMGHKSRFHINT
jgi:hypothetical protein